MKEIGSQPPELDLNLPLTVLSETDSIIEAYYAIRLMKILGLNVNVSGILDEWKCNGGYCIIKSVKKPSQLATFLAYMALGIKPKIILGEWWMIEYLGVFKPVFVNVTVYPRIVVSEKPRITYFRAVKYPRKIVNYTRIWQEVRGFKIVTCIKVEDRIVELESYIAEKQTAALKCEAAGGILKITYSGPKGILKLNVGGFEVEKSVGYRETFNFTLPYYGRIKVEVMLITNTTALKGSSYVTVHVVQSLSIGMIILIVLPALSLVFIVLNSTLAEWRKIAYIAIIVFTVTCILAYFNISPIIVNVISAGILIALVYFINPEICRRTLTYIIPVTLLIFSAYLTCSPLLYIMAGIGALLYLALYLAYPDSRGEIISWFKYGLVLYSIVIVVFQLAYTYTPNLSTLIWSIPDEACLSYLRTLAGYLLMVALFSYPISAIIKLAILMSQRATGRRIERIIKRYG